MAIAPETYVQIMSFYARQMRLLDDLDIDGYVATFTQDGRTVHAHRGESLVGRERMTAASRAALPRYAGVTPRHWNGPLEIAGVDGGARYVVRYASLVTKTDRASGAVVFESTFTVEDVLESVDGDLLVSSRTIHQDRDEAPLAATG